MDPMMPDLWEKESMKECEGEQRTRDTKHTLAGVKKLNDAFNYKYVWDIPKKHSRLAVCKQKSSDHNTVYFGH